MPFVRTDEVLTARELPKGREQGLFGVVVTDQGRYDKYSSVPWSPTDNGGRWRFWKWMD